MPGRIKSMTAFARAGFLFGQVPYSVEVRSTNARYLDAKVYVPSFVPELEQDVVRIVRARLHRGRIELTVREGGEDEGKGAGEDVLARELKRTCDFLGRIKQELDLDESVSMADVLKAYEILSSKPMPVKDVAAFRKAAAAAVDSAIGRLAEMRAKEGSAMDESLVESLEATTVLIGSIETLAKGVPSGIKDKLDSRLAKLLEGEKIDPVRLAQEVALLADKADISEEIVRLKSHVTQIRETRREEPPHGRKLEFLLQELLRETNTLAAKTPDVRIAKAAVELKTEIEKMREIARNVE